MTPMSTVTGRFTGSWSHSRGRVTEAEAQSALALPPDHSVMFLSFLLSLSNVSAVCFIAFICLSFYSELQFPVLVAIFPSFWSFGSSAELLGLRSCRGGGL